MNHKKELYFPETSSPPQQQRILYYIGEANLSMVSYGLTVLTSIIVKNNLQLNLVCLLPFVCGSAILLTLKGTK